MKKSVFFLSLLAGLFALASCNNANHTDTEDKAKDVNQDKKLPVSDDDMKFMVKAGSDGMFEVKAGQIALTKCQSPEVKDLANMMVKDHSAANEELKALAQKKNVTLPDSAGEDHQDDLDKLRKDNGNEFDKDYADMMVKGHKDAVDLFNDEANDTKEGDDAEIKAFASKTLPTLQMHLQHAQMTKDATDKLKKKK